MRANPLSFTPNFLPMKHPFITFLAVLLLALSSLQLRAEIEIFGPDDIAVGVRQTDPEGQSNLAQEGDYGGDGGMAELPANAIDANTSTKYFNKSDSGRNSGIIITPRSGPTIVKAVQFSTANDNPDRDPMVIVIEGSNDPAADTEGDHGFKIIYQGTAGLDEDPGRNTAGEKIAFENSTPYTAYRILVLETRAAVTDSVQYSEVQLFGENK